MITLYYAPNVCAMAQHIGLEWAGADYTAISIGMGSEELKKIAPTGAVPVMIDDETGSKVMTQGLALHRYIAQKYPEAKLGGDGTLEGEFAFNSVLAFINSDLHKSFGPLFNPQGYTTSEDEKDVAAVRTAGIKRIHAQMELLEQMLEGKTYLVDNRRTLADAYAFTIARWTGRLEKTFNDYPNIKRHNEMMLQDPAVAKVLKIHNPEA